ncbi:MAG: OmpL47-type beta-barrel domain-containing protein [Promethearchaeota archaeon]
MKSNTKKKITILVLLISLSLSSTVFILSNYYRVNTSNKSLKDIKDTMSFSKVATDNILYHENFSDISNFWDLHDVAEKTMALSFIPSDDSYINSYDPNENYGSLTVCKDGIEEGWYYSGESHLVNQDPGPCDIFKMGAYWYVLGGVNFMIYQYDSNWAFIQSIPFYCPVVPLSIYWAGDWFLVGMDTPIIYQYSPSWGFLLDYTIYCPDPMPTSICCDGAFWYLVGGATNMIYKYNLVWNFIGPHADISSQDLDPQDIYWDGSNFWMVGGFTRRLYKYDASWVYTGESYDLSSEDGNPKGIFLDGSNWWMLGGNTRRVYKYFDQNLCSSFIKKEFPYLYSNYTQDSNMQIYVNSGDFPSNIESYTTSNFDESTITWNNQPSEIDSLATSPITGTGWVTINLSRPSYYYLLKSNSNFIEFNSSEAFSNKPIINHYLSKQYQGDGILYCQTNETEILTLRSPNSYNFNLKEGDAIEITFNTTSSNEIEFNLRNIGMEQESYIISEMGNIDFSTRTVEFIIDENMTIDQFEFKGVFDDTKNLIVDDIKIYSPSFHIISPENKTYAEPISGYYPATYGFENDIDGAVAKDWWGLATVESSYEGHNKIIKHTNYSWTAVGIDFSNQTGGTIEFYFNTNNTDKDVQFNCFGYNPSSGISRPIILGVNNGNFRRYESGWHSLDVPTICSEDTWYHLRLDFDCTNDIWNTSINGQLKSWDDPFDMGDSLYINNLRFYQFNSPVVSRFDAIGFSWDQNYNIGDNLNEGLLISYNTSIIFDWISYSLDELPEKRILGNITIPMPEDGPHTIQIFGNNSLGTVFQTMGRNFMVDTTAPISSISFYPHSGTNIVNKSTTFTITADDGIGSGISIIRYKINNSDWIDYDARFNLSGYDYGYYLISFYAIDLAGHIEEENTLLVNLIEKPPGQPAISGYTFFFPFFIISVISLIISKSRIKKIK